MGGGGKRSRTGPRGNPSDLSKMKCPICGNRDGGCQDMLKRVSFFYIQLRTKFEDYSNLPCYVRDKIDKNIDRALPVKTRNGDTYVFDLTKLHDKTRIHGPDYNKFLLDYNLDYAEKIRIEMKKHNPYYLTVTPLDREDYRKEKVQVQYSNYLSELSVAVYSGGLKPNATQMLNINQCIAERGTGLGPVYVHCLTKTDVKNNGLRIPKHVASFMPIARSGNAYLLKDEGDGNKDAVYSTSTDGRIRFRHGWKEFAEANHLSEGQTVLIMFDWVHGLPHISFDIVD